MRNVANRTCRGNQNTRFVFNNFFSDNRAFCEIMRRSIVEPDRPQMKAYTFHGGYLTLQIHTLTLCNAHFFSTATMVARTRLNVTLYIHCLSLLRLNVLIGPPSLQPTNHHSYYLLASVYFIYIQQNSVLTDRFLQLQPIDAHSCGNMK